MKNKYYEGQTIQVLEWLPQNNSTFNRKIDSSLKVIYSKLFISQNHVFKYLILFQVQLNDPSHITLRRRHSRRKISIVLTYQWAPVVPIVHLKKHFRVWNEIQEFFLVTIVLKTSYDVRPKWLSFHSFSTL